MASETSELTFVRCPSCRSLVPATATRCRICNNPLENDASAKSDDGDAARAASRVRQKTITATPEDVAAALKDAHATAAAPTEPPAVRAAAPAAAAPAPIENHDDDFDPLSAYLEEIEDVSGGAMPVVESPATAVGVAATDPDDEFGFDLFDEPEIPVPAPVTAKAVSAPPVEPEPVPEPMPRSAVTPSPAPVAGNSVYEVGEREDAFAIDPLEDDRHERFVTPEPVIKESPPARAREEVRRDAPRPQPVQAKKPQQQAQGTPPNNQRAPGGAPAKPQQQQQPQQQQRAQQERQQPERRPQQQAQQQNQQQRDNNSGQRRDGNREQQHRQSGGQAHERRGDDRRGAEQREEERRFEQPPQPVASERGPKTGKMKPGRLFGWFVSYENPDGRAIELREGKFFVTGSSIRASDLILEDPSISTPHALMAISGDGGMIIQDLMSDRGVFVRTSSGGSYRREEGTVRVEHGDWVRFGDVEFLVIVVPHDGKR